MNDNIFDKAALHWKDEKGIGTALIPPPLDDKFFLINILQRMYMSNKTVSILIVTQTFSQRGDIVHYITHQGCEENDKEFKELLDKKLLRVITIDILKSVIHTNSTLVIAYRITTLPDNLFNLIKNTKFKLVILNKFMDNTNDMNRLYSISPLLDDFKANEINELRTSTPVEGKCIGVDITDDETKKLLNYYNDYINTSLSIFGNFDILQQARVGNPILNISANEICNNIARDNGWNDHLDMSIGFYKDIDDMYNPNQIRERASKTYEIIRNRSALLSDYEGKLQVILDIVKENISDKILIINKKGEFASKVTDFINTNCNDDICRNYHDRVHDIPATDEWGNPIYYKSGEKKGEPKYIGFAAQKTLAEKLFNNDKINVLSTNNLPDKKLNIAVDTIIVTSTQCEDLKSYLYRLSNVVYPMNKIKVFYIFVNKSFECNKIESLKSLKNFEMVNLTENENNFKIDENNFDFIVAD